jgi:hypothetical protein
MTAFGDERPTNLAISTEHVGDGHAGRRYFDEETGAEALSSKARAGSLSSGGRPIYAMEAKALSPSD